MYEIVVWIKPRFYLGSPAIIWQETAESEEDGRQTVDEWEFKPRELKVCLNKDGEEIVCRDAP